jgi:hypothetical protein
LIEVTELVKGLSTEITAPLQDEIEQLRLMLRSLQGSLKAKLPTA